MAEKVGVVNSLDGGKFFVKDEERRGKRATSR